MGVSRIDVLNQSFGKSMRGYSCEQVDRFMQEIADTLGRLSEDKSSLEARVAELQQRVVDYQTREETLRDTLVTTQRMTDDMKATAQREAQLIIDAAHAKAENLINQGHQRLAKIHEEIGYAKKLRAQFEMKVKAVIDSHQQLLDMSIKEDQSVDAAERKLTFLKAKNG